MAFSIQTYTADGVSDTYNIPFDYIDTLHIQVTVDDVIDNSITFPTSSSVKTSSIPANGAIVEVLRVTPNTSLLVDFQDGSTLTESDLDKSARQLFFVMQEALDNLVTVEQVNGLVVSGLSIDFPTLSSGDAGKGLQVKSSESGYELFSKGSLAAKNTVDTADIEDGAITTAKVTNANITTAKLANDAVTLAKLNSGTAGNLITYDASGDPAAVSTGSSGQVLTSNGAGAAPTFQSAVSPLISSSYVSSEQTITSAGSLTLAHGLGAVPKIIQAYVKNISGGTLHGIDDDERIAINVGYGDSARGIGVQADATNLYIKFGSGANAIEILSMATGSSENLTNSNWRLIMEAFA